jgi:Replication stress response SDE2 C-terminal/SPRY domain/Silencing defective 2 N-terminal ubiquitin domain
MGLQWDLDNVRVARKADATPRNEKGQEQLLVRFENSRTFVIHVRKHFNTNNDDEIISSVKQQICSLVPGWLPSDLEVSNYAPPFCNCRVTSRVRGGKGGFGTLLKGQSRQASANTTKDFSACRDLQGRRLRHVNEAVNYAVWKEWNDKVQNGTATLEEMASALINTDSGIAGWHLQLPAWSEVSSKKEHQRMKNLLRKWKHEQQMKKAYKQEQRELVERQVAAYVQSADAATAKLESTVTAALQQGLQKQAAKRLKSEPEPPVSLLTLSGDAVLALDNNEKWRIQSQSNFCTVGIVLDMNKVASRASSAVLYWEVAVVTAGLVQVGWATPSFRPNSETGDGVGDCAHSWGYDGSRSIKLHGETPEAFGDQPWKAGDVVGCCYDCTTGEMAYTLNGEDLGVAFQLTAKTVFPAISCNPGEIVELRLNASEIEYLPAGAVRVGDVVATGDVTLESLLEDGDEDVADEKREDKAEAAEEEKKHSESNQHDKSDVVKSDSAPESVRVIAEPLDLDKYESVDELEQLGLDRLKGALMAVGLKCGGTLRERASRLLAVRGLQPEAYPTKLLAKRK